MALDNAARKRELLDRLVSEKDIAAAFFTRVADQLEDVDRRRWFRRMGQDEKDQRKILVKHRREVCGANPTPQKVEVSRVHALADRYARSGGHAVRYVDALRLAAAAAQECKAFAGQASDYVGDRSCRIFLKILAGESGVLQGELVSALRNAEREQAELDEAQSAADVAEIEAA